MFSFLDLGLEVSTTRFTFANGAEGITEVSSYSSPFA